MAEDYSIFDKVDKAGRAVSKAVLPQQDFLRQSVVQPENRDPRSTGFTPSLPFSGQLTPEPALTQDPSKVEIEYSPFLFDTVQTVVKRRRPIVDKTKITPMLRVTPTGVRPDVPPEIKEGRKEDPVTYVDVAKQDIMEASFFKDKTGEVTSFNPEADINRRLKSLNEAGATQLVYETSDPTIMENYDIPFQSAIDDFTSIPDDIDSTLQNITPIPGFEPLDPDSIPVIKDFNFGMPIELTDEIMLTSGTNVEVNKALFARKLVKYLENKGVTDKRTIAGIVAHSVGLPHFGGLGFGDKEKIAGLSSEIVRFPIEAGMYIFGEAYDVLTEDMEEEAKGFDLRDSIQRQKFLDRFLPRMANSVQDRFTQLGIDVPYHIAEGYARRYSGLSTTALAIAFEVKGATKLALLTKELGGAKESKNFMRWQESFRKGKEGRNYSEEELLVRYKDIRNSQMFGVDVAGFSKELTAWPLVGGVIAKVAVKPIAYINSIRISSRMHAGMQLEEAALSVRNSPDVRNMVNYRRDLIQQRSAIIERSKLENKDLTLIQNQKIAELDNMLSVSKDDLRKIVADSDVPKFIKEANVQDAKIIIASAVGNQAFEAFGGDPLLGEFVTGMGVIVYMMTRKTNDAAALMKMYKRGDELEIDSADMVLRNMQKLSPEFQEALKKRVKYFSGLKQELVAAGVDETVLERSVTRMMGLAVLQVIEEGLRLEMKGPQVAGMGGNFTKLSENYANQVKFAAELRETLRRLSDAEGVDTKGTAVNRLYETVEASLKSADSMIGQLDADLGVIKDLYKDNLKGLILGGTERLQHLETGSATALDDAIYNMHLRGVQMIRRGDDDRVVAIRDEVKNSSDELLNVVKDKVSQIEHSLPARADVSDKVAAILPDGKIIKPAKAATDVQLINKPGDALGVILEIKNMEQRQLASAPYQRLDGQNFRTADGRRIVGKPQADGGVVLDNIMDVLGTEDGISILLQISDKTLKRSTASRAFKFLDDQAGSFLDSYAAKKGVAAEELIEDVLKSALDSGDKKIISLIKDPLMKGNENLIAASILRNRAAQAGVEVDTIPMTFEMVKELSDAFGQIAFKASDAARPKVERLGKITDTLMDNFTITMDNGQVIQSAQLHVLDDADNLVSVTDYLRKADEGWSQYKRRFYDDENLNKWLGWSDKKGRKPTGVSEVYPSGIDYGKNKPQKWLNFEKIANDSPEEKDELMLSLAEGIGEMFPDKVYRIPIESASGQALKATLEAHLREWMIQTVQSGKSVDFNEFRRKAGQLQDTFKGVTTDGKETKFINAEKVMGEVFPDFGPGAINEESYQLGMKKMNQAIQNVERQAKKQAQVIRDGLAESRTFLQRYTSGNLDAKDAASVLISGGQSRVFEIKRHFKNLGRSDEDIDSILRAMLADEVEKKAFKLTGVHVPDPNNPEKLIAETNLDEEQLKTIIGYGDEIQAEVIKDIVGEKTYNIYKAIIEFSANEKLGGMSGLNVTGIPREFSVESYISRFYAINRGVVSFRYVGTEAVLQSMRRKNMNLLSLALTDPKIGTRLMEMVSTGKPLPAEKEKEFFELVVLAMERMDNWRETEAPQEVISDYGHYFTYGYYRETGNPIIPE